MCSEKIIVDVPLDSYETEQLRQLFQDQASQTTLTESGFFNFDFKSREDCVATIELTLADSDLTIYGASLRKIPKPAFLWSSTKMRWPEVKMAVEFLEHLVGSAVIQLKNYSCSNYQRCTEFVAEKCNLNSAEARRQTKKECLGFSCTECQFFQTPVEVDPPIMIESFFYRMYNPWELTAARACWGVPLIFLG